MVITILQGHNKPASTLHALCGHLVRRLEAEGCEVRLFCVHARPLPLMEEGRRYDHDDNVKTLRAWVGEADGVVLASPEYHGAVSGALKNALDFLWPEFAGKAVMAVAVAGGDMPFGALSNLQSIVRNLHAVLSPDWIALGRGAKELDEAGAPIDPKVRERCDKACLALVDLARKLAA